MSIQETEIRALAAVPLPTWRQDVFPNDSVVWALVLQSKTPGDSGDCAFVRAVSTPGLARMAGTVSGRRRRGCHPGVDTASRPFWIVVAVRVPAQLTRFRRARPAPVRTA